MITGTYVHAIITLEAATLPSLTTPVTIGHHQLQTIYAHPKLNAATAEGHTNKARDLTAMHGRFGQGSTTSVASQQPTHPPSSQPTISKCNLYIPDETRGASIRSGNQTQSRPSVSSFWELATRETPTAPLKQSEATTGRTTTQLLPRLQA